MSANAVVLFVGKKGSGKTTALYRIVAPARRVLIADVERKWTLRPGDEVIEGRAALLSRVKSAGIMDPAVPFQWVYRDDAESMQLLAPGVAYAVRHCTLVVDELFWVCNARYIPGYLLKLLQIGRERRVNLLGTTREPAEIHSLLFPTADVLYFFHVDPGNGLDLIRRRYGREMADELARLGPYQHRIFGEGGSIELIGREGLPDARARKARVVRR